ncbi:hypothetical protein GF312_12350 [Candidatus Poribacteria bacterium]|nr:hypothetical protein [Candidatus Poribacteria bacterium]
MKMQDYNADYVSPRVKNLLNLLPKLTKGSFYTRRIFWTESYRETEGQPQVIKQAKAFSNLLSNIPVNIFPHELIVGAHPKGNPTDKENELLQKCQEYWSGKTVGDRVSLALTDEEKAAMKTGIYTSSSKTGHMTPDFDKVLRIGINGIKAEIRDRIENLSLSDPNRSKKAQFLHAAAITMEAICVFAKRYADEALKLAQSEENPQRKDELIYISEICNKIPAKPADTFHEACQSVWSIHLLVCFEEGESHAAFAPGRFDQYTYPYYERDIESGRITKADAAQLIDCLWIKFNEIGNEIPQTMTLGGTAKDGFIGDNELTSLCIESTKRLRVLNPSLVLRWHKNMSIKLMDKACDLIKTGMGFPQLFNDEIMQKAMLYAGVSEKDARDAVPGGCVELSIEGKTNPWVGNFFNLPKCLLLALNDGIDWTSGESLGTKAGKIEDFKSFHDVINSYKTQVAYFMKLMAASENSHDIAQSEITPFPFLSSLVSDCIEKAMDITEGGAKYNFTQVQGVGIANVADSLAAIKKLVFEEERISLTGLADAMKRDFDNCENLRQMLINDAPKYGNNDPFVDKIAQEIVNNFYQEVRRYKNPRGGQFVPGLLVWTLADSFGSVTSATPDGRKSRTVFSDSIGAAQGRDVEGPTALIKSVTKIDYTPVVGGLSFNMKFSPSVLSTDESVRKMQSLINTYFNLGGMQVQINVVDKEILQKAQQNPQQYSNLIVRVSGWSARFTSLSRKLQDDIISRTHQEL